MNRRSLLSLLGIGMGSGQAVRPHSKPPMVASMEPPNAIDPGHRPVNNECPVCGSMAKPGPKGSCSGLSVSQLNADGQVECWVIIACGYCHCVFERRLEGN